ALVLAAFVLCLASGCGGVARDDEGPVTPQYHAAMLRKGDLRLGVCSNWRANPRLKDLPRNEALTPEQQEALIAEIAKGPGLGEWEAPYHVNALITIGRPSVPVLLKMLEDSHPTTLVYTGNQLDFGRRGLQIREEGDSLDHRATIADLADFALRRICAGNDLARRQRYEKDVGWRYDLGRDDRLKAIAKWRAIALAAGDISETKGK
ncbi:MAG: hypothetical protein IMZ65_02700, partial [Planctomycetes bacterium]|nr:hypothetical protein [Planctomycetota bacterium]